MTTIVIGAVVVVTVVDAMVLQVEMSEHVRRSDARDGPNPSHPNITPLFEVAQQRRRVSHSPARVRWSNQRDTSSVPMIDVRLLGVSGGSRLEDDARRRRGRSGAMIVILSSPPEMSTSSS
ncbi:hypothetical protein ACHAW5_003117 [Stephanodiscus triporus]|uniref:Secreted protein n=1 Tax=Stephanodiscus triporus TaxID=2934178 RepID=A0ABD3MF79_9STRA